MAHARATPIAFKMKSPRHFQCILLLAFATHFGLGHKMDQQHTVLPEKDQLPHLASPHAAGAAMFRFVCSECSHISLRINKGPLRTAALESGTIGTNSQTAQNTFTERVQSHNRSIRNKGKLPYTMSSHSTYAAYFSASSRRCSLFSLVRTNRPSLRYNTRFA